MQPALGSPIASRGASPDPAERFRSGWLLLAALAVWVAFAVPFFRGQIYTSDDLWAFHLPVRAFYADSLTRGEAFDWMPSLFAGFYLSGEGQAGVYHPLHWLLYRWLPLPAAFGLELLLAYPFLFAGMFLFLRRLGLRRDAALFGSLVFTFGSFNTLHFVHPNAVGVVAHLPWLLWAVDWIRAAGENRASVGSKSNGWKLLGARTALVLLTASQLLLGYPQYVWFSLLTLGIYLPWRARGQSWKQRARPMIEIGLLLLLGLGLAAVQFLPTVDALRESSRSGVDGSFFAGGNLHPINVLQLGSPYLFEHRVAGGNTHEFGFYLGALPALLMVWGLSQWSRLGTLRPVAAAALLFASLMFVLAMGELGGLYKLQTWLPFVGRFRLPARYVALAQLGLAVVAACGWHTFFARRLHAADTANHELQAQRHGRAIMLRVIAVVAIISLTGIWIWGASRVSSWPLRLAGPALLGLALLLLAQGTSRRWVAVAMILFTAADLAVYGGSYAIWQNTFTWSTAISSLKAPQGVDRSQRVATELPLPSGSPPQLRIGDQLTLAGFRQVDGYAGLEPTRHLDYTQPAALRAAGVHWVYSHRDDVPAELIHEGDHWWRVADPLPRAALLPDVRPSVEPAKDIERVDLRRTALVDAGEDAIRVFATLPTRPAEADTPATQPAPSDKGEAHCRWLEDRPGKLVLQTRAAGPRLLVVTERFHRGWKATIDGHPAAVIRANGEFLGCVVAGGDHRVSFTFDPASLRWGKWISWLSLGLLGVLIVGNGCQLCWKEGEPS